MKPVDIGEQSSRRTIGKGNARGSGYQRQPLDFYREPHWAVDALLDVERFEGLVLDPACGSGTIPLVCRRRGITATGSDIVNRGFGDVMNFFDQREPVANIVSNPPFALVERFVEHALTLASDKVAILGRLTLLEGQRRRVLLERTPLARVWVFSRRVSMPPGGRDIPAKGGSVAFAWFVWHQGYRGAPTVGWVPRAMPATGCGACPPTEFGPNSLSAVFGCVRRWHSSMLLRGCGWGMSDRSAKLTIAG